MLFGSTGVGGGTNTSCLMKVSTSDASVTAIGIFGTADPGPPPSITNPNISGLATVPSEDYYVRDWTDSSSVHDEGQEPSTNPVWWTTSDVWNRVTDPTCTMPTQCPRAGNFNSNDQPAHQVAECSGGDTHNFAFVRVHRKAAPAVGSVNEFINIRFLFAEFGVGRNYEDLPIPRPANSSDLCGGVRPPSPAARETSVAFAAADLVQTLPDGSGVMWDLPEGRSSHVCLAVEIGQDISRQSSSTSPHDPYWEDLLGKPPGPPNLLITSDNNKAQMNMDLPSLVRARTPLSSFAIAHNAGLSAKDMIIRYSVPPNVFERIGHSRISVLGESEVPIQRIGTLQLKNMLPGENRWIEVAVQSGSEKLGETLPVNFDEVVADNTVNGFTIAPRMSSLSEAIVANLKSHRAVFNRADKAFRTQGAREQREAARSLLEKEISAKEYLRFLAFNRTRMNEVVSNLTRETPAVAAFGARSKLEILAKAVASGDAADAANAHATFLNALDAAQTMAQLSQGDPADFLQMVRWQVNLYQKVSFEESPAEEHILKESRAFVQAVERRLSDVAAYPDLLKRLLPSFRSTAEARGKYSQNLTKKAADLEKELRYGNVRAIERTHRDFLLALSATDK